MRNPRTNKGYDLRNQVIEPFLLEHEMHVTRPVRMPLERLEQFPHRPIVRNRIRYRHDSLEPEFTLLIATQYCSSFRRRPVGVLHVIKTLAVSLPDIDFGVRDRRASRVAHAAENQTRLALRIVRDRAAVCFGFGVVRVERSEDGAFSRGGGFGVVDTVDE